MNDPCFFSAGELARCYATRELSPLEVVRELFDRADRLNHSVNALYAWDREGALDAARASDGRWRAGHSAGPLDGVPICIKDHLPVRGLPVTWGCRLRDQPPPSADDSAVVARLREAGAIVFGKTTMCEMGFYPSGISTAYGPSRNPWDTSKTAGGSSGGAAAAVAAGLGPLAIGSDGGGSIRMPAAFTGTFGFKSAGGRVPVTPPLGLNPTVGPIARTVEDVALVMTVITQPDRRDYFAMPADGRDYRSGLDGRLTGLRIGALPSMGYGAELAPCVERAFRLACVTLERAGAAVEVLTEPFDCDVFDAVAPALLPFYAQRFLDVTGGHTEQLLPSSQRAIEYALGIPVSALIDANRVLGRSIATFMSLFDSVDCLVSPTMADTAFDAEAPFPPSAPQNPWGYAPDFACFVSLVNFCALPACSICCGFDSAGLPIGLQIIGQRYDDFGVLRVASVYEKLRDFVMRWPAVPRTVSSGGVPES